MVETAQRARPVIIGVAGGTGAGKTTVSNALLARVGTQYIAYLPHDVYYHDMTNIPRVSGEIINFDHPDALDTPLLIEHVRQLQQGQPVHLPIYDFTTHSRSSETRFVEPHPVILVEGILIFAEPLLRALLDVRVFVDTDADIRLMRRLKRDISERGRSIDSVIHQYMEAVRPMHLEFVEPSKQYADVIVPHGGYNHVAINLVADHVINLMRLRQE